MDTVSPRYAHMLDKPMSLANDKAGIFTSYSPVKRVTLKLLLELYLQSSCASRGEPMRCIANARRQHVERHAPELTMPAMLLLVRSSHT